MPETKPPRYLTLSTSPEENLLGRTDVLDNLLLQLTKGDFRWIVLHGESGLGKTVLANACFHEADKRNLFGQFAWVPFATSLPKSLVKSIITDWEPPAHVPQNEEFYNQAARREALRLRNYETPQLIIFDGVPDETAVLNHLDLLEIRNAKVLITTRQPFADKRFLNFRIPPLEEGDVLHFFAQAGGQTQWLGPNEIQTLRSNAWLMRLLTAQTPKTSEKAARDFLQKVFTHASAAQTVVEKVLALAKGIFDTAPLPATACWTLMQIAALPPGRYDLETLIAYLIPPPAAPPNGEDDLPEDEETAERTDEPEAEIPDDLHLLDLSGFQRFEREPPNHTGEGPTELSATVSLLTAAGWLSNQDGELSIHDNAVQVLKTARLNQPAWFAELCNCFSINYFLAQHPRLKVNLQFETHLLSWLDFVEEGASDDYLGVLHKLITYYMDTIDYWLEAACRLKYLSLIESVLSDSEVIDAEADLAENYRRLGQYEEARRYAEEALRSALNMLAKDHFLVAKCQTELGLVLDDLGQYDRARDLLESALASDLKNFGMDHPIVAVRQSNLANVYRNVGQYELAQDLQESALASDLKNFGPDHPNVALSQSNLANVYLNLGQYERAQDLLESALASDLKNFGPDHPAIAVRQSNLANTYLYLAQYERAQDLLESALASDLKNFGPDHPAIAVCQSNLANAYLYLGQYESARDLMESALASGLKNFGPDHPNVAYSQYNLAKVYRNLGQYDRARDLLESSLASDLKNFGPDHPNVAKSQSNLGEVYRNLGQYDRARDLLESSLASDLKNFGPDHPNVAFSQLNLGAVFFRTGEKEKAKEWFGSAYRLFQKLLGEEHPKTRAAKEWLDSLS